VTADPADALITPGPYLGDGVVSAFSGRVGGISAPPYESLNLGFGVADDPAAVRGNRAELARACALPPDEMIFMRQTHSADVWYAVRGAYEPPGPVDAMFTDVPGRALCVLAADCVPVLIADPVARIVGAAHAGREGLAGGVVPALITAMTAAGASPSRTYAVTGPSICGGCYEVPADLQARVSALVPAARCDTFAGTTGLDIAAGVRAQLAAAGVANITTDGRCTRESAGLYSYRRDGVTGRFAGLIWLSPR
jgi:purine-nucleoside/S-methyl-5'-thioadenosine phosphorylase / adenosine deaminase